ncbi:hypothetical protein DFAR_3170015 [Desulfarculales bacterium]
MGQRELPGLALGRQQAAPIRVSDHLDHRRIGLHAGTLQANLRRTRSGHRQLFQDRLTKLIRKQVIKIAQDRKKKPVFIIDEASLLRL